MSDSQSLPLLGVAPRKVTARPSEADRKALAVDWKRRVGLAVERGIVLAGLTKQSVSFEMGYQDQSALARWISGIETPQFAKLFGVEALRGPLVIALAELADVDVVTTISIKRIA